MAEQRRHHPSSETGNAASSQQDTLSLVEWLYQATGVRFARVGSRLRGNDLHLLIEHQPCPTAATILPPLRQTLTSNLLENLLPAGSPQIYRVIVYARPTHQTKPVWTEAFYVNQPQALPLEPPPQTSLLAPTQETVLPSSAGGDIVSLRQLAQLGQPEAIARYLSHALSNLGVAVKVKTEGRKRKAETAADSQPPEQQSPAKPLKRLLVACEASYTPDPLLLAEPIAQWLRELELRDVQDAVVFGQVSGESRPEWLLRVDLTPTGEMLKTWARWGDVQAIARLLNQILSPQGVQVSALLKDATLHLTCCTSVGAVPDKLTTLAAIAPVLESLTPQGITGATVYGVINQEAAIGAESGQPAITPGWIHWLDLPALQHSHLTPSTLTLAQQGNLEALTFLLTRLLNPNLNRTLAMGGIRVQLRQKEDLLHIMTDAPTCPNQGQVGTAIARFLKPLSIPDLKGVRIYGRRAGQKQPLWSYGVDFVGRDRLVPEATPEFAASDAYVDDLLSPPGALVLRSDLPPDDWRSVTARWLESFIGGVQRSLIRSQLFIPAESADLDADLATVSTALTKQGRYRGAGVALVWSAVGLLLVVQSDWLLGRALQPAAKVVKPPAPSPSPTPTVAVPLTPAERLLLPEISFKKGKPSDTESFNSSGFTQPGSRTPEQIAPEKNATAAKGSDPDAPPTEAKNTSLVASPARPQAVLDQFQSHPTFNSRQLDEKVALYRQYLDQHGAPPDVLVIGSSRTLRGVDPAALKAFLAEQGYSDVSVFNFGINGATAQVVNLILHQVIPQEKLPKLIVFADGARAFNSGRQDITYNGIVASEGYRSLLAGNLPIPGSVASQAAAPADNAATPAQAGGAVQVFASGYQAVNRELDRRLGSFSQAYSQRDRLKVLLRDRFAQFLPTHQSFVALGNKLSPGELSDATSPAASALNSPPAVLSEGGNIDIDGFLPLSNRFNPVTYYQKYARVSGDYDSDYDSFNLEGRQAEAMVTLVQFAQARQIPLVFVNLPLTNDYLDPARKRHEEAFQQHMLTLSTQLGFTYLDLSLVLANQPDYFSDPSHLNRYGAYEVSRRLAQAVMIPWQQAK